MSKPPFQTPLSITYIGTATIILQLPNLTILTDPYFSLPNTEWLNLGKTMVPKPDGSMLQITMDAKQGVRLMKDVGAEVVVPLHFEGWNHFKESRDGMLGVLKEKCVRARSGFWSRVFLGRYSGSKS